MWISATSIKRPVFATMVIVSFMVLGIVSLGRLGIDLFPEVNFPFVNISIVYPGAGPEEVETLVTRPIEDAVAGINGVKRVISTSTEGFSRVGIELRLEIDPQAATAAARGKVAAIRGCPRRACGRKPGTAPLSVTAYRRCRFRRTRSARRACRRIASAAWWKTTS